MIVELERLTIRELLIRSFGLFPALPAIGSVGEPPLSYSALQDRIEEVAALLVKLDLHKGDRVALVGENSPNWVIAYLALTASGLVAVPILPGFPETDTRHIIRNSESRAVFADTKGRAKVGEEGDTPLQAVISLEDFSVAQRDRPAAGLLAKTIALFRKWRGDEGEEPAPPGEEDMAAIIYTSGTTGHSKGVVLTHRNIVYDTVHSIERFPIGRADRFLSILPLSHTFEATGGLLCPLAVGASIAYMQGLPTPQKLMAAMAAVRPTAVLTVPLVMDKIFRKRVLPQFQGSPLLSRLYRVPFMRRRLHRVAGRKLMAAFGGKLRFFMFGGAPLNEDVEQFLGESGIHYSTGYGMTETAPIMTINPIERVKIGSCGRTIPGIELAIHQPDPHSGVGEIIARGPIVMQGYYKNPEATAQTFLPDGWLRTGDLGYFDDEGYLFIKGRSKNVIIGPSGENIYPEAVEARLLQSPYLQEVVVYEDGGRLLAKAYLDFDVLDKEFERSKLDGAAAESLTREILERVRQEVNQQLPGFSALSRIIEHPEPFEKTPTNKVKRYLYIPARG